METLLISLVIMPNLDTKFLDAVIYICCVDTSP